MSSKEWDEITYLFPNFNDSTVEVWEWISNFIPHYIMDVIAYPWWDLKHVDKRGPACYISAPNLLMIMYQNFFMNIAILTIAIFVSLGPGASRMPPGPNQTIQVLVTIKLSLQLPRCTNEFSMHLISRIEMQLSIKDNECFSKWEYIVSKTNT